MTEHEWLTSDNAVNLLSYLTDKTREFRRYGQSASYRQLRLFVCAVERLAARGLQADLVGRPLSAVLLGEREADGLVSPDELVAYGRFLCTVRDVNLAAIEAATWPSEWGVPSYDETCDALRDIVGNPFRPYWRVPRPDNALQIRAAWPESADFDVCLIFQAEQVRDLADSAYDERLPSGLLDNARLAVLADALEEAGCPVEDICPRCKGEGVVFEQRVDRVHLSTGRSMRSCPSCWVTSSMSVGPPPAILGAGRRPAWLLTHLRDPGPHYLGCRALDLLRGEKEWCPPGKRK